ncbi:hypothetical protein DFH09DRAFT_1311436 [Mycena vulgaris]|nr:hypothetical protein DFH09DRAFT_1311436 [Mycena vulgaris]
MTTQPLMISTIHRPPSRFDFEDPSHNLALASPLPTPPRPPSPPSGERIGPATNSQPRARRSLSSSPFLSSRRRLGAGATHSSPSSLLRRERPIAAAAALFDSPFLDLISLFTAGEPRPFSGQL